MPDETLARLRTLDDEALGIDAPLVARALSAFSLPASTRAARAPFQGTFHRLYEVRDADARSVLRIASMRGDVQATLMDLESRVMNALHTHKLPVPACDFRAIADADAQRGLHRLAFVEGASISSFDADERRTERALQWVASFLAQLHRMHGTGFGPLSLAHAQAGHFHGVHSTWEAYLRQRLTEHVEECARIGAIDSAEAKAIAAQFDAAHGVLGGQGALLHGDPGGHNFIVDGDGIRAVIDWEDALLGDALFDLASLCTFHPERRHAGIFAAYGVPISAGSVEWTRFWLYFLRIALAKTVHRHRFGYVDRADRAPASGRIRLALERLREQRG